MKLILPVEYQLLIWCVQFTRELEIKETRLDSILTKYFFRKFTELCGEETPMVRRVVAIKIGEIAQYMDK